MNDFEKPRASRYIFGAEVVARQVSRWITQSTGLAAEWIIDWRIVRSQRVRPPCRTVHSCNECYSRLRAVANRIAESSRLARQLVSTRQKRQLLWRSSLYWMLGCCILGRRDWARILSILSRDRTRWTHRRRNTKTNVNVDDGWRVLRRNARRTG